MVGNVHCNCEFYPRGEKERHFKWVARNVNLYINQKWYFYSTILSFYSTAYWLTTYQAETFRNIHSGMIFTFSKTQFFVLLTFLPCFKSIPVTEHICNENTLNLVQKGFSPFASLNPNVPFKIQYWEPLNNLVYFYLEGPWEKKIRNTVFKEIH